MNNYWLETLIWQEVADLRNLPIWYNIDRHVLNQIDTIDDASVVHSQLHRVREMVTCFHHVANMCESVAFLILNVSTE
jgi:hypothetical protein